MCRSFYCAFNHNQWTAFQSSKAIGTHGSIRGFWPTSSHVGSGLTLPQALAQSPPHVSLDELKSAHTGSPSTVGFTNPQRKEPTVVITLILKHTRQTHGLHRVVKDVSSPEFINHTSGAEFGLEVWVKHCRL